MSQTIFLYQVVEGVADKSFDKRRIPQLLPSFAAIWPPLHPLARQCLAALSMAEGCLSSDHSPSFACGGHH